MRHLSGAWSRKAEAKRANPKEAKAGKVKRGRGAVCA